MRWLSNVLRDNVRRRRECCRHRRGIAGAPVEADVPRHLGRNLRRTARSRGLRGGHRRQRRIVHHNAFGGIERLGARLGDDQCHRLADVPDLSLASNGCGAKANGSPVCTLASTVGRIGVQPVRIRIDSMSARPARPAARAPRPRRCRRSARARAASAARRHAPHRRTQDRRDSRPDRSRTAHPPGASVHRRSLSGLSSASPHA